MASPVTLNPTVLQDELEFKNLTITGPISARPLGDRESMRGCYKILLMGTTGSGKSTFIESLSPSRTLKISGNTLESVTQTLQPYLLTGVCPHPDKSNPAHSIVLIDTPGMADDKISEYRVVGGIVTWLKERTHFINHIIYFDRITDIRMAGSRKRSMDLFKAVSGVDTARNVTIATTMWDQIGLQGREGDERRKRAGKRFEELRSGYWEHFTSTSSTLTKSHNTLESSLSILNTAVSQYTADTFFEVERSAKSPGHGVPRAGFGNVLYVGLLGRLERLVMRERVVVEEIEGLGGLGGLGGSNDGGDEEKEENLAEGAGLTRKEGEELELRDELMELLLKQKEDIEWGRGVIEWELRAFGSPNPEWGIDEPTRTIGAETQPRS